MNFLDIIICIPMVWGIYKGITKGLIIEAANILALFLGVWGAVKFSGWVADLMRNQLSVTNKHLEIIAFCVLFFVILISVYFLGKFLNKIVDNASLGLLNKLLGALFGAGKFLLLISILFFIINAAEQSIAIVPAEVKKNSLLYTPVSRLAPLLIPGLESTAGNFSSGK